MPQIDHFRGDYAFLSNMSPGKVTYQDFVFPTVENAYVAAKSQFPSKEFFEKIAAMSPGDAKKYGRTIALRDDWLKVRLPIMEDLVKQKFMNNKELGDKLLATWDCLLVEGNTWGDTFWGVCNGQGENVLGNLLMAVRDYVREKRAIATPGKKFIIAGGRGVTDYNTAKKRFNETLANRNFVVISGKAKGADKIGEDYASEYGMTMIPFPAIWDRWSMYAGRVRNTQMSRVADGLIALWDGKSTGTKHMIDTMINLQKPVLLFRVDQGWVAFKYDYQMKGWRKHV